VRQPALKKPSTLGRFQPRSRREWRAWLEAHHDSSTGVWLVFAKKHTGIPSLSYSDAVEEALCFGWIDSVLNPLDDRFYMQKFTPRKPTSVWSALNRTRVEALVAGGQMTPAGMALVTLAKKTGRWESLSHVEALTVPPELQAALDASRRATKSWAAYTPSQRKAFLYWLNGVKRPETRTRRVAEIVRVVARGVTPAQLYAESRKRAAAKKVRVGKR
jgi:uncharacterized protein YdeI (YjbR/CyaY-like superfamily)